MLKSVDMKARGFSERESLAVEILLEGEKQFKHVGSFLFSSAEHNVGYIGSSLSE